VARRPAIASAARAAATATLSCSSSSSFSVNSFKAPLHPSPRLVCIKARVQAPEQVQGREAPVKAAQPKVLGGDVLERRRRARGRSGGGVGTGTGSGTSALFLFLLLLLVLLPDARERGQVAHVRLDRELRRWLLGVVVGISGGRTGGGGRELRHQFVSRAS